MFSLNNMKDLCEIIKGNVNTSSTVLVVTGYVLTTVPGQAVLDACVIGPVGAANITTPLCTSIDASLDVNITNTNQSKSIIPIS